MSVYISSGDDTTKYISGYSDLTGKRTPEIELKNISGNIIKLSDYKGKNLMLTFFTTWCPHCIEEMPIIDKVKNERNDIEVIAINVGEDKETVENFLKVHNLSLKDNILLGDDNVTKDYSITKIPTTYFIDKNGHVYTYYNGNLTHMEIINIIDEMK